MAKVITFSREFPCYHPKSGEPTYFVEKFWESLPSLQSFYTENLTDEYINFLRRDSNLIWPKFHTIRAGKRFKKGEYFSPRVWGQDINPKTGRSGPYHSKQIIIAPDTKIESVTDVEIQLYDKNNVVVSSPISKKSCFLISVGEIAQNDGLLIHDFINWFTLSPEFKKTKHFSGQIICWNKNIKY